MVKCIECGYLAVRDEYTDGVCEATEFVRSKGRHKSSQGNSTKAKLFCFRNCPAFPDEAREEPPPQPKVKLGAYRNRETSPPPEDHRLIALNEPVDCKEFRVWQPGKAPEDHEEMTLVERLDARAMQWRHEDKEWRQGVENAIDRRFERSELLAKEARDEQKKWEKQLEALHESRHQESLATARRQSRTALLAMIISAISLAATLILAIVQLFGRV